MKLEPMMLCPLCKGNQVIDHPRNKLIAKLLAACKGLNDDDLDEVILYAQYLRSRRRRK